ncbi:MAG: MlaD family protein [Candidatus Omnitrophota bacterium]
MITKEQSLRLGIFLIVSSVLLVIILAVFMLPKLREEGDTYYINFRGVSVNGLSEGSDVKYHGVKIGRVSSMTVNEQDLSSILVYVKIKKNFPVKTDMRATLQYLGITGLKFVEITGGKNESPYVKRRGEILTEKGLGEKAEEIMISVDSVVSALNDILKKENRDKISGILTQTQKSSEVIADLLQKQNRNLNHSIEKFDLAMEKIVRLSDNLITFSNYLNQIKDKAVVEKVAAEIDELVKTINQTVSQADLGKVMGKLDRFIDTADTSVRQMEIHFNHVGTELNVTLRKCRESVDNISRFIRELREDPTVMIRKHSNNKD